jgi:outer membrane immunogenic protein
MRIAVLAAGITAAVTTVSTLAQADPVPSFNGSHVGINAGAAWGLASFSTNPNCPADPAGAVFCNAPTDSSAINGVVVSKAGTGTLSPTAVTGGVQAGHDWQHGTIVVGAEADVGALNLGQSAASQSGFPFAFAANSFVLTERMSTEWLATIRGRIGYTPVPRLLLYATGGLAFTDFKFSSSYADNATGGGLPGGTGFGSRSGIRTGWTIGGGGEWMLDACWSIKAEYLYVDFGSERIAVPTSNTPAFQQVQFVDGDLAAQLARVGLNYRY